MPCRLSQGRVNTSVKYVSEKMPVKLGPRGPSCGGEPLNIAAKGNGNLISHVSDSHVCYQIPLTGKDSG